MRRRISPPMRWLLALCCVAIVIDGTWLVVRWGGYHPYLVAQREAHRMWVEHRPPPQGMVGLVKAAEPFLVGGHESSPVVVDGKVVIVMSVHDGRLGQGIQVFDAVSREQRAFIPWPYAYGSAVNHQGEIWVTGVGEVGTKGNEVALLRLSPDWKVLERRVLFRADAEHTFYNTSLTFDGHGYVMAVEVNSDFFPGTYHPKFFASPDMKTWVGVGREFSYEAYAACPTLKFVDGFYYLFYLAMEDAVDTLDEQPKRFRVRLARTRDFVHFQPAVGYVLVPDAMDGANASDIDMVENVGKVTVTYNYGNQMGHGGLRLAHYDGTLKQMVRSFWYLPW